VFRRGIGKEILEKVIKTACKVIEYNVTILKQIKIVKIKHRNSLN